MDTTTRRTRSCTGEKYVNVLAFAFKFLHQLGKLFVALDVMFDDHFLDEIGEPRTCNSHVNEHGASDLKKLLE